MKNVRPDFDTALIGTFVLGWLTYAYTLFDVANRHSVTLLLVASVVLSFKLIRPRSWTPLLLLLPVIISTLFGVLRSQLDNSDWRPWTHALQQFACVGVAVGSACLPWNAEFKRFRRLFVVLGVVVTVYGVYQVFARMYGLPLAFLPVTNLQQETSDGLQRGAAFGSGLFRRASSVFVEPTDFGLFGSWLFCFGLGGSTLAQGFWPLAISLTILLASQSLGAFIGFVLAGGFYLVFIRRLHRIGLSLIIAVVVIVAFAQAGPEEFQAFSTRVGYALEFDRQADSGRVMRIPHNLEVVSQDPIVGHGLGRIRDAEPEGVTAGLLVLLIERGAIGTALYLIPFLMIGWRLVRYLRRDDEKHRVALLLYLVNLYALLGWFAALYFPPFWLCLGFCLHVAREAEAQHAAATARFVPRAGRVVPVRLPVGQAAGR